MKASHPSRRAFIANSTKATIALGLGGTLLSESATAATPSVPAALWVTGFKQDPLPYAYPALEPSIDAQTMEIHYTKHAATYAKNLAEAAAAEKVDTNKPVEELLARINKYSEKMRNNAGGHYNHELFWKSMRAPQSGNQPGGTLAAAINQKFGSFDQFKTAFADIAKARFGSGWAWLILKDKSVLLTSTPNQDNPLMPVAGTTGIPLLGLDVWEHAYYLKYQNKRPDYINAWWDVVNWDFVQSRYDAANK
ncbi:superoxide dismutase [Flavihumibacter petaseus]|uniref:Superoxide dismutase n=1 Tax=Flavihumibacter petaseus NBRC 106054 TaxID=1220578 RepID=A0A0E9MVU8_9BACT|nr:superoxide dismutase [Flavihumibacter petaseus]GAO41541.1 superoxide dismutase [Mn] [Flavihumibacter petaseus NBRC 106054]